MAIARQALTLEEFLKRSERKPALEYVNGVVTQKVAPKGQHSRLQFKLAEFFNRFAEPRRLAAAFPELRTTFAGASPVPDVAVYRWERIPRDASGKIANDFFEPPDIAIEIVSPRQRVSRFVDRCRWYVANRVPLALVVYPQHESVILFRPGQRERTLRGADQIDFGDVVPGLQLTVQELFDSLKMP